jgi:alcohol dehydrogenase YqhD (iron-dependent ADH family)
MKKFTDFTLQLYTEIVFGLDTEKKVAELVQKHGGTKVMLVYGGGSIKKIGLYGTVTNALKEAGIPFVELGGVEPNPRRSLVEKGVVLGKAEGVDFLLALGGGSTIDTAKAIAFGLAYDGPVWDFYSGKAVPKKTTKVGTIHTIAAAGSETSTASVILDDIDTHKKSGCNTPFNRPVFAIMNPALLYSVSAYQTAAGASDVFAHTLERYFVDTTCYLGDQFAEGLLRDVIKYAPIAVAKPNDYESHRELMMAGSFAHNDVTGIGRSGARGGPHGLESYISATYDTAHGAGLSIIMPAWLAFVVEKGTQENVERAAQFAVKVMGVEPDLQDPKAVALEGIRRLKAWEVGMGMPKNLQEHGVPESDLEKLVTNCRGDRDGILHGYVDLTKDDVRWIYTRMMQK